VRAPQARCVLCPDGLGYLVPTTDDRWVHMLCALWIPEVHFNDLVRVAVLCFLAASSS
jgi:hypothetical protein